MEAYQTFLQKEKTQLKSTIKINNKNNMRMKKNHYEKPQTLRTAVEVENGFMSASIMDPENGHDQGLTTEEHGFADPDSQWEGDYSNDTWD